MENNIIEKKMYQKVYLRITFALLQRSHALKISSYTTTYYQQTNHFVPFFF